jgi:hypothetical protein
LEVGSFEDGSLEVSVPEGGFLEVGTVEPGAPEVGTLEAGSLKVGFPESRSSSTSCSATLVANDSPFLGVPCYIGSVNSPSLSVSCMFSE